MSESQKKDGRKRQKVTRACDTCKNRKKRCTGDCPCGPCRITGANCTFESRYSRGTAATPKSSTAPQERFTDTADEIEQHDWDAAGPFTTNRFVGHSRNTAGSHVTTDAALGSPPTRLSPDCTDTPDGQYHGRTSTHAFVEQALRTSSQPVISLLLNSGGQADIFSYGDRMVNVRRTSNFNWPSKSVARDLLRRYFDFASPTYRFLHQPTVHAWLEQRYRTGELEASRQAILLSIMASAMISDEHCGDPNVHESHWVQSERLHLEAEAHLANESGPPKLESVQARFAAVQYLLSSSRPNKALHTFGSVAQLCHALGLHRRRAVHKLPSDIILHQCQKRMFWSAFTLDKYISTMLGRPVMLRLEDTNQDMPDPINDEDLRVDHPASKMQASKDCLLHATIAHAELARLLAKPPKDQPASSSLECMAYIDALNERVDLIKAWQTGLIPVLSRMIHPSSLIQPFRRQNTVLRLAYLHGTMSVTRPMILRDLGKDLDLDVRRRYLAALMTCIEGALETVDVVSELTRVEPIYESWWNTQYITFTAISILFVYAVQVLKGRIPDISQTILPQGLAHTADGHGIQGLIERARKGQQCLDRATTRNAPGLRYGAILDRLSEEADAARKGQTLNTELRSLGIPVPSSSSTGRPVEGIRPWGAAVDDSIHVGPATDPLEEGLIDDLLRESWDDTVDVEFWTQLDSLPLGSASVEQDHRVIGC